MKTFKEYVDETQDGNQDDGQDQKIALNRLMRYANSIDPNLAASIERVVYTWASDQGMVGLNLRYGKVREPQARANKYQAAMNRLSMPGVTKLPYNPQQVDSED